MSKTRIEAFTDAVIAIVMTLLVLGLKEPNGDTWMAFEGKWHEFLIYLISFISLGVYWNNHHHLFHIVKKVAGWVLWANNLFILMATLFPFATNWVMDHPTSLTPQLLYGIVILGADLSYLILGKALVSVNGKNSPVGHLFQNYRKMQLTLLLNILALLCGWLIHPVAVLVINGLMLTMWFIPEKKVEKFIRQENEKKNY